MDATANPFELMEPRSPELLVPHSLVEPWMIYAGGGVILLVALLIWQLCRKRRATYDPQRLQDAAYAEATTALRDSRTTTAREAAVMASFVLRRYLSVAAGDPSLFETHEETLARHEAFAPLTAEAQAKITREFSQLAALKYSPQDPGFPSEQVVKDAQDLLDTIHQGFRP